MTDYATDFTDIRRNLRLGTQRQADSAVGRLDSELEFADNLCALHPDQAPEWRRRIVESGRLGAEALGKSSVDTEDIVGRAEEVLSPIGKAAKEYVLLCVSHAHIDMNWMWSWPETVAVTNDTFDTMLKLLDEFSGFIFSQSQAAVYRLVERFNPAMFEAIGKHVRDGRWEVTASQWVEGDKNLSSGESITRHLLYSREYFQEKFGLAAEDVTLDFEPDTFGHPATLPTILARGGIRYYYHCRGSLGPSLYWWVGPDGSRLLTHCGAPWYMGAIEPKIATPLISFSRDTGLKMLPVFYGVGDHGGGPTRRDLRRFGELNSWPVFPRVEFSTLHNFFRLAEEQARDLPEVRGERNFVFAGCYTSQARQKWANRHGENLLYTAEAAAVIGERVAGVCYPAANLDEAWRGVLFSQFHDILPGSGVRETRHYTMGTAQEGQASAATARTNALRALAARVDTESLRQGFAPRPEQMELAESGLAGGAGVGFGSGAGEESWFSMSRTAERAFLIFNPLPRPRREVVEAKLWDTELDLEALAVSAEGSAPQRVQVLEQGDFWGHAYVTVAFPVEVPALGYRTVCISDRSAELGLSEEKEWDYWGGQGGWWRQMQPRDYSLENELLSARLDPGSGGLVSFEDRKTGRQWVPEGKVAGIFQRCLEENEGMTAWVIGRFLECRDLLSGGRLSRLYSGPWLNAFRWKGQIGKAKLELDVTLREGSPRLEYQLRADWREMGDAETGIPNLRVRFPLATAAKAPGRYEIPYGSVQRGLCGGEEVPGQRWAEVVEEGGAGVVLANTSKYGFSREDSCLSMTLLRASIDPDPLPDLGEHVIDYALTPHGPA